MNLWAAGYGTGSDFSILNFRVSENGLTILQKEKEEASSYLAVGDELLFSISERKEGSAVHLLTPDDRRDTLKIPGGELCHICWLPKNRVLLGACYGTGEVFSVRADAETASFGNILSWNKQGTGAECLPGATRAHCILPNAAETQAISANIALDRLYVYDMDGGILRESRVIQLPKGIGPRHLIWREDWNRLYVITEYSCEILVLDGTDFHLLARSSTRDESFSGENTGSTLVFSADDRFLYAGNRGEDSIAVFAVGEDHFLSKITNVPCGGKCPRDLALADHGRYLAAANQGTGEIVLLPLDPATGIPGEAEWRISCPEASFITDTEK